MIDVMKVILSDEAIRDFSILSNFVSAILIGPFLAFAVTPDAGFRCPQAFLRLVHRWALVAFSITLMYNATLIFTSGRVPIGSALILNVMILVTTCISAIRHSYAPNIPEGASWHRRIVLKAEIVPK